MKSHHTKISSILAGIPLFEKVDAGQLEKIARVSHEFKVGKGHILFNKGDPAEGFYIVVTGSIKISFISREGKEYIAEIFSQGQSFGEAAMFLEKPYPVCAQALVDSSLLHIPKEVLFDCLDHCAGFSRTLVAGLCMRLVDRVKALEALTVYSSSQKVIGYLLKEVQLLGVKDQEADVILPVSKSTLASHLNIAPETLSRVLHDLVEENLVCGAGKTIHIRNIQKLRNFNG